MIVTLHLVIENRTSSQATALCLTYKAAVVVAGVSTSGQKVPAPQLTTQRGLTVDVRGKLLEFVFNTFANFKLLPVRPHGTYQPMLHMYC